MTLRPQTNFLNIYDRPTNIYATVSVIHLGYKETPDEYLVKIDRETQVDICSEIPKEDFLYEMYVNTSGAMQYVKIFSLEKDNIKYSQKDLREDKQFN